MTFYSKAPLRIGLAGGGTDVSPYCNLYEGAVVNATISLYANATIKILQEDKIIIETIDRNEKQVFDIINSLPINGCLDLHKAVYNRLVKDFNLAPKGFHLSTHTDAPAGSGLGTSSTLVVAIMGVFNEMFDLKLSRHAIAKYAYDIERNDLQFSGGRQDQYAAAFGGFNFMEFLKNDEVRISPLPVTDVYKQTLENNLVLYFTDSSRNSADIINEQVKNVLGNNEKSIDAMHHLKEQAQIMKEKLLHANPDELGPLLHFGFAHKKNMASNISNPAIEAIYETALKAGATGGKISGAGGGGFMVFYCPDNTRVSVIKALNNFGGQVRAYNFVGQGLTSWSQ